MKISGAESLVTVGNIFAGVESALVGVQPTSTTPGVERVLKGFCRGELL